MNDKIKFKKDKGYYALRSFDGKHGVPKVSFYLGTDGKWHQNKILSICYFQDKEILQAFLDLRLNCEKLATELGKVKFDCNMYKSISENLQKKIDKKLFEMAEIQGIDDAIAAVCRDVGE